MPATDQTAVHISSRATQLPGPLAEHPDPAVPAPSSLCPRCRHSAMAGEVGLWSQVSVAHFLWCSCFSLRCTLEPFSFPRNLVHFQEI